MAAVLTSDPPPPTNTSFLFLPSLFWDESALVKVPLRCRDLISLMSLCGG